MSIPRIVHYVWMGGKEMPPKTKEIIENNKKILGPKWETKIWTEKEFDVNSNEYTKYHYEGKNWAFVSDYLRAYVLKKEGGFYFDTDILLNKSLDEFIDYDFVTSRTMVVWFTISILGSKKNHKYLNEYLDVTTHPILTTMPPKLMSTHIYTYVICKNLNFTHKDEVYVNKEENLIVLKESQLQLDINDGENIAVHLHHDNWKGRKWKLKKSKYYNKKISFQKNLSPEIIEKEYEKVIKINKKIERILKK
ncbi:MAG: hypothetical protein NC236_00330 [Mycoplasma sp.]|nr:hypothetical protein [Mycoplasma sp.]